MNGGGEQQRTRQELLEALREMSQRIAALEQQQILHIERVKELNCLYDISKLHGRADLPQDQLLQRIVERIPAAFQYPEITCVRLLLPERQYATANYRQSETLLSCPVRVDQQTQGSLDVCYLDPGSAASTASFLDEERSLLEAIAEQISAILTQQAENQRMEKQQEQLVQFDKLVALGTLVSGVAHEINNPNNFIMLNAPLLHDAWKSATPILDDYYRENGDFLLGGLQYSEMRDNVGQLFEGVQEGARRIKSIVESLKGYARPDTSELRPRVDINAVVSSALQLLHNKIARSTERFAVVLEPSLPTITGNAQRLEQVILNLLQNACEALPDNQHAIELTTSYDQRNGYVVVTVSDEGLGIAEESMSNILDPFFTTKRDEGGTGLGLAVSASIIKHHQGTIQFESKVGEGTVVRVGLPTDAEPEEE